MYIMSGILPNGERMNEENLKPVRLNLRFLAAESVKLLDT